MTRSRWLLLAATALACTAVGCAHCDTCDDFPMPCAGGGCGTPVIPTGPMAGPPIVVGEPATLALPGGSITSQPAGTAAGTSGSAGSSSTGTSGGPLPLPPNGSGPFPGGNGGGTPNR